MSKVIDDLYKSILEYQNTKRNKKNQITESIDIIDKMYQLDLENFSNNIKEDIQNEMSVFWVNESASEVFKPEEEFISLIKRGAEDTTKLCYDMIDKLSKYMSSVEQRLFPILQDSELIRNSNEYIYFPIEYYKYTNLGNCKYSTFVLQEIYDIIQCIPTGNNLNSELYTNFNKDTKDQATELYSFYRGELDKISNVHPEVLHLYLEEATLLFRTLEDGFSKDLNKFYSQFENIDKVLDFSQINNMNDTEYRIQLLQTASFIKDKVFKLHILDFSARLDAIIEYIDTVIAILLQALNQIKGTEMIDYDIPDDTLSDTIDKIEMQEDLTEVTKALIYNDTVLELEAAGLMTVNEETSEQVEQYFFKVSDGMTRVIEKIQTVIRRKIAEKLTPVMEKIKAPDKPDPTFSIKNYKTFNFERIDNISPKDFDYEQMKESLKSKDEFMHRYYPELEDNQEKNIYKTMLKKFMTEQTSVQCTQEILDNAIDFLTKDYAQHLEGLENFRTAIETAAEKADNISKVLDQNVQRDVENIQAQQQIIDQKQNIGESVVIEKTDNTTFEDEKQTRNSGEGNTKLMKACTLYCTIMSQILSARIKVLNYAYNDRMKIVWHYVVKNKFHEQEEQR